MITTIKVTKIWIEHIKEIEAEEPDLLDPWAGWRLQVTDANGVVITALPIDGHGVTPAPRRRGYAR